MCVLENKVWALSLVEGNSTSGRRVRSVRYAIFQMADVASSRQVFAGILELINGLRGLLAATAPA